MTAPLVWQKSTFSQEQGECVELTAHGGAVLLRESDDPTVVLTTTRQRPRTLPAGHQGRGEPAGPGTPGAPDGGGGAHG